MLKRFLLFFIFIPSFVRASILVLPFENRSHRNYFWLSESISYSIFIALSEEKIDVVPLEKRNAIFEELQIPITTPITRATSIKVSHMAGADRLISGDFIVTEEKVIVSSRILDVKGGKLGEIISVEGNMNELITLQNFLSWRIFQKITNCDELKKEDFLRRWTDVSLPAWENFIKGLLTKNNDKKEVFLLKSLNLSPQFSLCRWELSLYYFKKGDYDKCLNYISSLTDSKPLSLFFSSLCHFYKKNYEKAMDGFKRCIERGIKKVASANNIGVIYAMIGEHEKASNSFALALQEGEFPDVYFNMALISKEQDRFFENIKIALMLSPPKFSYLHPLYRKIVSSGNTELAEKIKKISKEHFSSDLETPIYDFKNHLIIMEDDKIEKLKTEEASFYKKSSISQLKSNDLKEAESSIRKYIHIAPFDWEAYLILSQILVKKKDWNNALKELTFSLWLDERAENNLEMGKLLIERGEKNKGLEHIRRAMEINPSLEEAKELLKKNEK